MHKTGIILILLFCTILNSEAQPDDSYPPITISGPQLRVDEILKEITRQTGVEFSFNAQLIDTDQVISFAVQQTNLERTLQILCKKINAEFGIIEGQIILRQASAPENRPLSTLSGFIGDEATGESLIGASILVGGTARGVVTNAFGYYSIQLEPGTYQLLFSYVGYQPKKLELKIQEDVQKDLTLQTIPFDLPDVIVKRSVKELLESRQMGEKEFSPDNLKNMPEFGGESGLVKGLQSLPGISMHSDGSAFYYARGGERDQNLIIIDDAPIYNPSHLFGFYSTVIPDFAKSIKVYKSDMPANIGDRLSSIVSIRTKDGNLNKFEFSGALNPLIYRFSIEAPIVKKRGSLFASFRRSNFEWLYKKSSPEATILFGDFNFKLNYKFNNKNRLFFTTIYSGDNFSNSYSNTSLTWANFAATLRWNHIFGPKLFSNTTIYTGSYGYQLLFSSNYWQSGLGTLSLKSDFTHYVSPQYQAKFGLEIQGYFINPGTFSLDSTIAILPEISANASQKLTLYYQGTYEFSDKLKLNAGLRMVNWANSGPVTHYAYDENYEVRDTITSGEGQYNNYLRVDPRTSLQYQLDSTSQVKASLGLYHQYLQLISDSQSPFTSFEVWLPASPNIKPQSAVQLSASYLRYLKRTGLEFSAAVYYKKYFNQIDYEPHPSTLLNPLIEGELRFGTMRSYGLELMLTKELGRLNGWLAYTFSRTHRQTPEVNGGRSYRAFQDRPHDISLMLNYRLAKRTFLSAYWTIYSGSTFSSPTGFYTFNDQTIPVFDEKNNDRLPSYQRLDLAIKWVLNKKPAARYQHSLTFSIYNIFLHKNIIAVNFNRIPVEGERPVVKANLLSDQALTASQTDLIRFFPSLTYKFKL